MLIGTISFIISWLTFLLFSNKKKFPLFVTTVYLGIILALITDLMMFVYPLWEYPGTMIEQFFIQLLNGFGTYFVVIYLFLQSLPNKHTVISVIRHVFYWTLFTILLEILYLNIDFIKHGLWWNIGYSYVADWLLFIIFYIHHKWAAKHSVINEH